MKFKLTIILIVAILAPVGLLAQVSTGEGSLNIHRGEREANRIKRQNLIEQYGLGAYEKCYTDIRETNPYAVAKSLREAEYCLKGQSVPATLNCPAGQFNSGGSCESLDIGCKEKLGEFSQFTGNIVNGIYTCECAEGFSRNESDSACVQTACPDGMIYYSPYQSEQENYVNGRCMDYDSACQSEFGEFARFSRTDADGSYFCGCRDGYDFSGSGGQCTAIIVAGISGPNETEFSYLETLDRERQLALTPDPALSRRLAGRIMLQIEENGEAWYVNPENDKKYFLGRPADAWQMMREFGLGVSEADFNSYGTAAPSKLSGWILLRVEAAGEAYYVNPEDAKMYYLGRPADAWRVMSNLGLGIKDEDIRKIEVGEL